MISSACSCNRRERFWRNEDSPPSRLAGDGLHLEVFFQSQYTKLPPNSRLPISAKRRHRVKPSAIDVNLSSAHPSRNLHRTSGIARPHSAGESVDRIVRDANGFVVAVVGENG